MTKEKQLNLLQKETSVLWSQLNRSEISPTRAIFKLTLILSKTISYLSKN